MPISAGGPAPDVTFMTPDRQEVPISSFKGQKTVVLAFYPRAFTGG